ncbi:hypothetical protein B566_EDAN002737 [Ephemera danica]|nr:hypothetical protein B566_EDAN002737 [Ephemera danica]
MSQLSVILLYDSIDVRTSELSSEQHLKYYHCSIMSKPSVNTVDSGGFKPDTTILEFLEVSIHQLLFIHQIYPSGIFSRKQKYGIPVQVSGHPLVNNYITHCLKTAQELLKLQTLSTVMLAFYGGNNHIIKKIVFDVSSLQRNMKLARGEVSQLESALRDTFPWTKSNDHHVVNPQIVPLTSLDVCGVFMQIFAEEMPRNIENELHTPRL